jgi:hypothetical protein
VAVLSSEGDNKMTKVIYQVENYRIIEISDVDVSLDDLKGDCFNPLGNPSINPLTLLKEELAFECKVESEGVFGYALEVWSGEVGEGWTHVDSCFGFVGQWNRETNNHYIVDELIAQLGCKLQARQGEALSLYKIIETKYIGPTSFRGSRVKAFDANGNTVTIEWRSELNVDANHAHAAKALLEKIATKNSDTMLSIVGYGSSASGKGYVFTAQRKGN